MRRLVTFLFYIITDNKRLQTTTNGEAVHPAKHSSGHSKVPYINNGHRDVKPSTMHSKVPA